MRCSLSVFPVISAYWVKWELEDMRGGHRQFLCLSGRSSWSLYPTQLHKELSLKYNHQCLHFCPIASACSCCIPGLLTIAPALVLEVHGAVPLNTIPQEGGVAGHGCDCPHSMACSPTPAFTGEAMIHKGTSRTTLLSIAILPSFPMLRAPLFYYMSSWALSGSGFRPKQPSVQGSQSVSHQLLSHFTVAKALPYLLLNTLGLQRAEKEPGTGSMLRPVLSCSKRQSCWGVKYRASFESDVPGLAPVSQGGSWWCRAASRKCFVYSSAKFKKVS